ncbi:MAG TPA: helix-turn-helix domain-containing protein [Mycobacteriales bacterium]|nr:helix-turn-helix domain-containing protein [Mycobacteriales bacterium]
MREWLSGLLDYDAKHGSDLVQTLSQYLECGGELRRDGGVAGDPPQRTLRYRLQRIREVTSMDLGEVDSRLNLQSRPGPCGSCAGRRSRAAVGGRRACRRWGPP